MTRGASCEEVQGLLSDYAEGELPEKDAEAVEAHLASCRPCAGELTLMRALVSGLHRIPEETAPPAILQAIQRRLPAQPAAPPRKTSWFHHLRPWHAASVGTAAAMAVAVFLMAPSFERPTVSDKPAALSVASLSVTGAGVSLDGKPVSRSTVPLAEGARVEVAGEVSPGAAAEIAFADGTQAGVSTGSRLAVGGEELRLDTGSLELDVTPQKLYFRVRTPEALVTVWGTRYRVTHKTVTSVEVDEGKVHVEALKAGGASVTLTAGQRAVVDAGRLESESSSAATPEPARPEDTRLPLGDDR